jgi:hypothetical protein
MRPRFIILVQPDVKIRLQLVDRAVHLLVERYSIELVERGLMEALADTATGTGCQIERSVGASGESCSLIVLITDWETARFPAVSSTRTRSPVRRGPGPKWREKHALSARFTSYTGQLSAAVPAPQSRSET